MKWAGFVRWQKDVRLDSCRIELRPKDSENEMLVVTDFPDGSRMLLLEMEIDPDSEDGEIQFYGDVVSEAKPPKPYDKAELEITVSYDHAAEYESMHEYLCRFGAGQRRTYQEFYEWYCARHLMVN